MKLSEATRLYQLRDGQKFQVCESIAQMARSLSPDGDACPTRVCYDRACPVHARGN